MVSCALNVKPVQMLHLCGFFNNPKKDDWTLHEENEEDNEEFLEYDEAREKKIREQEARQQVVF